MQAMTQPRKASFSKKSAGKNLAVRAREIGRDCVGRAARAFARKVTQIYEGKLAPQGLTTSQFVMMNMIAAATDDTLSALAADAGLDPSTLTRNLQGLEKLGLVEIASVEADQRKRAVWLTEAGARKLEAAIPAWDEAQAEVAKKLGAGFRADLRRAERTL
jgi:DNA-binding MarR family transcriptional regulator